MVKNRVYFIRQAITNVQEQQKLLESEGTDAVTHSIRGLSDTHLTCYANTMLQCLLHFRSSPR
ncbi:UNVERIFIED_CONTAM: hypothetical protein FKN15_074520 [Acipenser sinensis]